MKKGERKTWVTNRNVDTNRKSHIGNQTVPLNWLLSDTMSLGFGSLITSSKPYMGNHIYQTIYVSKGTITFLRSVSLKRQSQGH